MKRNFQHNGKVCFIDQVMNIYYKINNDLKLSYEMHKYLLDKYILDNSDKCNIYISIYKTRNGEREKRIK